jgi:prepilin-type N-terminal cleavage/methylation domain-containing protein
MTPPRLSRTSRAKAQDGVTLVELLVSIAILGVVTTMIVVGYLSLNRSTVYAVQANDARGEVRDALGRMTVEVRDAQPRTLPTTSPGTTPSYAVLTAAQPMEVDFYSVYNLSGSSDGSGTSATRLTRIYLDTSGTKPQKKLVLQKDTNNNGAFDSADRSIVLARAVVNATTPDTTVTPNTSSTAIFSYAYRDLSGNYLMTANSASTLDLTKVIAVQIRVISDISTAKSPKYIDLITTVRPRNSCSR